MTRDITPFGLRMPSDLKARVDAAAESNGRSINAECVARLQASFAVQSPVELDVEALAEAIASKVAAKLRDEDS